MDNKESSVAAALSAAAPKEDRSEAKNMISPMSTSCAPSSRKRPFDALEEGSGNKNDTTAATACYMNITETNGRSSSIEAMLKDMQQKMNHMQSEIDTTKAENIELKSKYYELEIKVDEITTLKDEYNEGSYENKRNIYDMQIEIDKLSDENKELKSKVEDLDDERMDDIQFEIDTLRDENDEMKSKYEELEIEVKDLTLNNEYNEWDYEADDIPASYWIEREFSEEYAVRMAEFLGRIKEYTHQLRRGESPKDIDLAVETDLLHDDILLPHWQEFADALKQYQKYNHREDYGIEGFVISSVQLHQNVISMLAPILHTVKLNKFALSRNIGSDLVSFMSDIIQSNPHLEEFDWRNQIESVDDMRRLCNSNKNKVGTSLKFIGLKSAFDGNNLQMMQTILDASHHLMGLALCENGIGTAGVTVLVNWLVSNPSLNQLYLINNNLNDTDAALLANSLQSNTNLEWMHLEDNNDITSVGRQALLETVFNVSSLNSCAASNHACQIHGLTPDISNTNTYTKSSNRIMKTFTMLSATDEGFFNMNCFGDLSYKLIPDVLRLAQGFRGKTPELSEAYSEQTGQRSADWNQLVDKKTVQITSMFELLRGWAVPCLSA